MPQLPPFRWYRKSPPSSRPSLVLSHLSSRDLFLLSALAEARRRRVLSPEIRQLARVSGGVTAFRIQRRLSALIRMRLVSRTYAKVGAYQPTPRGLKLLQSLQGRRFAHVISPLRHEAFQRGLSPSRREVRRRLARSRSVEERRREWLARNGRIQFGCGSGAR